MILNSFQDVLHCRRDSNKSLLNLLILISNQLDHLSQRILENGVARKLKGPQSLKKNFINLNGKLKATVKDLDGGSNYLPCPKTSRSQIIEDLFL